MAHLIGPAERQWFRRCRRAWDLGSRNRQNWEPREGPATPDVGRAIRDALAVYYFPGMWEWPRAIVYPRAFQAFEESLARQGGAAEERERLLGAGKRLLEAYFEWAPAVDAFTPVRVEADFEANIPDPQREGDDLVGPDGLPVRYRDRVQLLVVDASDAYWIVEHRVTEGRWSEEEELRLDEPSVTAAWAWEQFYLGMMIAGTVHNELRLDVEEADEGAEPPGGGTARHPRSRDWARARAAARPPAAGHRRMDARASAVPEEVTVEAGGEQFRRWWIPRPRAEVAGMGTRLSAEVADMIDPRLVTYPSPTPEHCEVCDYRRPCLVMNEGGDPGKVLAEVYRQQAEEGPEEGRLGGGTWSMNRGAAPPPQWRPPAEPP